MEVQGLARGVLKRDASGLGRGVEGIARAVRRIGTFGHDDACSAGDVLKQRVLVAPETEAAGGIRGSYDGI